MSDPAPDFAYRLVMQQPWAITLPALEAMVDGLRLVLASGTPIKAGPFDAEEDPPAPVAEKASGIGVIPIRGTLKQHDSMSFFDFLFGGTSYDGVSRALKTFLADESIKAIVFDIDSPGGTTYGVAELANEILAARGKKPMLALANAMAASAACHLGASCDRFYSIPSGLVGSIGVYFMHQDISKMADEIGLKVTFVQAGKNKTRGNEFEPLTDEDVAHYQAIVNEAFDLMVQNIARGRGVSAATVRNDFGQGDVMTPTQAKRAGLVDGIKTLADVIAEASTARPRALKAGTSAETEIELEAGAETDSPPADEEAQRRLDRMRLRSFQARAAAGAA